VLFSLLLFLKKFATAHGIKKKKPPLPTNAQQLNAAHTYGPSCISRRTGRVRFFTFLFSVRRCLICDDDAHFASLALTGVSCAGSTEKETRRNSGRQNYSPLAFLISFTRRLDYSHQKRRCCSSVLAFLELLYRNSLSLGAGGGGGELFLSGCSSSHALFIFWLILLQLFSATLLT
jgi:hypothetical protein